MEQSQVDYFSLDVEGNELDILKTIPFHKINVKVTEGQFIKCWNDVYFNQKWVLCMLFAG